MPSAPSTCAPSPKRHAGVQLLPSDETLAAISGAPSDTSPVLHLQVKERKSFLASLESMDNGKPLAEAEWDVVSSRKGGVA